MMFIHPPNMEARGPTTSNISGVHEWPPPCSVFRGECSHLKQLPNDDIVNYITIDSNAHFKMYQAETEYF
jgi:hypothetical protein